MWVELMAFWRVSGCVLGRSELVAFVLVYKRGRYVTVGRSYTPPTYIPVFLIPNRDWILSVGKVVQR